MDAIPIVFGVSLVLLLILVPNDIWKALLHIGAILLVGWIAWWSLIVILLDL